MTVALVALRVGIGWHFFCEGTDKIQQEDFSSAGFLSNARGPAAGFFKGLVWDADGSIRLGYDQKTGTFSTAPTAKRWNNYRTRVVRKFKYDEEQQKLAKAAMNRRLGQLQWYLNEHRDEIRQYFLQLNRWQQQQQDASRREVSTLKKQSDALAWELANSRRGWLATISQLERDYQLDLRNLGTTKQQSRRLLKMKYAGWRFFDSKSVDYILPYFDIVIGICLVIGLFTSTTALAGACFLMSVVLSQFPGAEGAAPVYYQGVEALGLCLLAALRAGQYAGLDFFVYCFWRRFKRPKQGAAK